MKTSLIVTIISVVAAASAIAGYCLGFRQAWELGQMAGAAPRGAVGLNLMRSIDADRTDEVTYYFESQVDAGLMLWHDLSNSHLFPYLNQLSGDEIYPGYELYVRRLAAYRKEHPSPLWDPKDMAEVEAYLAEHKSEMAEDLTASSREAKEAMDAVVSKYAP